MEIHKTKIYVLAFVLCLILAGCKSTESVLKEYQKVLFTDGINVNEAQLIAQKRIMGSAYTQSFDSLNPLVLMNEHTDKYKKTLSQFYKISYNPSKLETIPKIAFINL